MSVICHVDSVIPVRWVRTTHLQLKYKIFTQSSDKLMYQTHGPLARYVKLRVAHAPGMPRTFSPPTRVNDPDLHHGTCLTQVP